MLHDALGPFEMMNRDGVIEAKIGVLDLGERGEGLAGREDDSRAGQRVVPTKSWQDASLEGHQLHRAGRIVLAGDLADRAHHVGLDRKLRLQGVVRIDRRELPARGQAVDERALDGCHPVLLAGSQKPLEFEGILVKLVDIGAENPVMLVRDARLKGLAPRPQLPAGVGAGPEFGRLRPVGGENLARLVEFARIFAVGMQDDVDPVRLDAEPGVMVEKMACEGEILLNAQAGKQPEREPVTHRNHTRAESRIAR